VASLQLRDIKKSFGKTEVIKGISLTVADGEFVSLVGRSGCGKSTLLRIICGLEAPDSGEVLIDGLVVNALVPKKRNIAMVFQDYALYPHMTVAQNIAMPLVMARLPFFSRLPLIEKVSPKARAMRPVLTHEIEQVARQLHIEHLLDRRPAELSGGQRQRVALGRALVRNPQLFLMDEPLSNLDAKLRAQVRRDITALHRSSGLTFVYVTHDQVEAMTMSNRIALLDKGHLLQTGSPALLYDDPECVDVARFIGVPEINILPAYINKGGIYLGAIRLPGFVEGIADGDVQLGLRPDAISVCFTGQEKSAHCSDVTLVFTLKSSENLGHELLLHGCLQVMPLKAISIRIPKKPSFAPNNYIGQSFDIGFDYCHMLVFSPSGKRLREYSAVSTEPLMVV